MEVTVTSNGGLDAFRDKLERLADGEHRRGLHKALAAEAKALITQGFQEGRAPNGRAWRPTLKGNPPLRGDTLKLSTSAEAEPTDAGIVVKVADWKATFHQATRPMLPSGSLPSLWRARFQDVARDYFRAFFGA